MAFGSTSVKAMELHWNQPQLPELTNTFDLIVASDWYLPFSLSLHCSQCICFSSLITTLSFYLFNSTFFKEFHNQLARITKMLLKAKEPSEALFFSPKRGDSLAKFLKEIEEIGLHYVLTENYDAQVWECHETLVRGDESWPNYDKNHCYPLLIQITNHP